MVNFNSLYEKHEQNAQIVASASETFFIDQNSQENKSKHGSFNALEIINDSDEKIKIELDGLSTRSRILQSKSAMVINPEEEIYFNTVKITNQDAANAIAATELTLIARIIRKIPTQFAKARAV